MGCSASTARTRPEPWSDRPKVPALPPHYAKEIAATLALSKGRMAQNEDLESDVADLLRTSQMTADDTGWSTPSLREELPPRRPIGLLLDEGNHRELTTALLEHHLRRRRASATAHADPALQAWRRRASEGSAPIPVPLHESASDEQQVARVSSRFSGRFHSDTVLECDDGLYPPTAATIEAGMAMVGAPQRYPPTPATIGSGLTTVG